ncbi:MAG: NAD-dependent epimerase/dehydratase family protein [Chloroflexota bacterium]|nr:MAG: NAD-dependent epimerase/dehydratase family protein [Chloroflexota bacterium]
MKILVTGGAGFIGSNLVDALAEKEAHEILVADDFSTGTRENLAHHASDPRVRVVELDIRDKARVRELMRGVDFVYHLAVQCVRVSIRDPYLVHEVNATATLHLLTAALDENVKRFVYCSSSEVYGTALHVPMNEEHPLVPTTPYGASKLAGEVYARSFYLTYGLPVTVVRPFNTYGPREHFEGPYGEVIPKFVVRALNDAPLVVFGDGSQTRDFTEVSDTVRGLIAAGECDALVGNVVNIARGQEVSINELAQIVLETLPQSKSKIEHQSPRPGDVQRHSADIARAKQILGFEPRVEISDGVKRYVDWLMRSEFNPREMLSQEKLRNWE